MTHAFARAAHFFSPGASFGDCTHVTAYFVVPMVATDIIYTVEYRPERDISFQKNIFQRGERRGEKIPPPGLRPGILTPPAAVPVVCCAYETGVHADLR